MKLLSRSVIFITVNDLVFVFYDGSFLSFLVKEPVMHLKAVNRLLASGLAFPQRDDVLISITGKQIDIVAAVESAVDNEEHWS